MNPIVRRMLVSGIISLAAAGSFLAPGCAPVHHEDLPERASFAPGSEPAENASQARMSRRFPRGEVTAVWIKSGIPAIDEASAAYCRAEAEDFIRRAGALDSELAEADGGKAEGGESVRRSDVSSEEEVRYTLSIKGGLSRAGGVIGRLWIKEEYLGGSRKNITIKTEMHSEGKGTPLSAGDLFEKPQALPAIFSRVSRESLAARGGQEDMYLPGTAPAAENFRHFLVTENGVMLYFEPCHVASWAKGMVKVPVSTADLQAASPRPFRPLGTASGRSGGKRR